MILKVFPIHAHAMPHKIHTLRHSQHCVWYVFDSWTHRKYTGYTQEHHCYTIAMARVTLARPWLCTKLVPASLATTSMHGLTLERNDVNGGWISTSKSYNNHILITHFGKSCYMLTSANICYIWYIANICKPSSNPKEPNLYQPMRYKIGTNMVQMMYKWCTNYIKLSTISDKILINNVQAYPGNIAQKQCPACRWELSKQAWHSHHPLNSIWKLSRPSPEKYQEPDHCDQNIGCSSELSGGFLAGLAGWLLHALVAGLHWQLHLLPFAWNQFYIIQTASIFSIHQALETLTAKARKFHLGTWLTLKGWIDCEPTPYQKGQTNRPFHKKCYVLQYQMHSNSSF